MSDNGGKPTPVTTETAYYPTMLPDGRHFLFLSGAAGLSEEAIFLASLDSKETRKLTEANSRAELSPSGHLLFLRGTTLMAQPFDTSALRVTGEAAPVVSEVALVAVSREAQLTVAKNGLVLYQTGGIGRTALTWFDRSGKTEGVIDDTSFYEDVRLSPDGKSLAATRRDPKTLRPGVWITDLARSVTTRVATADVDVEFPGWSPDEQRLAFGSHAREVYVLEIESGRREKVAEGWMPIWSPDGTSLLYSRTGPQGVLGLFLTPLGGERKPVTYLPGELVQPAFSPDGRWVAYTSAESGESQVYVQPFPAGHGKWQISKHGGAQPVWRSDGRELFYKELSRSGGKIIAVPVTTGATFEPGIPKELFAVTTFGLPYIREQYTVTPDGQRFLVNVVADSHPQTILLQNWLTPERR